MRGRINIHARHWRKEIVPLAEQSDIFNLEIWDHQEPCFNCKSTMVKELQDFRGCWRACASCGSWQVHYDPMSETPGKTEVITDRSS